MLLILWDLTVVYLVLIDFLGAGDGSRLLLEGGSIWLSCLQILEMLLGRMLSHITDVESGTAIVDHGRFGVILYGYVRVESVVHTLM